MATAAASLAEPGHRAARCCAPGTWTAGHDWNGRVMREYGDRIFYLR